MHYENPYLSSTPFVVSIKVKAEFWFLFFCLAKNLGIRLAGLNAFLVVQTLQ